MKIAKVFFENLVVLVSSTMFFLSKSAFFWGGNMIFAFYPLGICNA